MHRATLVDGTPVAVKVQHPGIDVALRVDLDHAERIGGLAGWLMLPGSGAEPVAEVRSRIEAELDYRQEARTQGRAIRRFLLDAWLGRGLLFADPHAGNWIFHSDGRVTVLDFGCVVPFAPGDLERLAVAIDAIGRADVSAAERALATLVSEVDAPRSAFVTPLRLALAPLVSVGPARPRDLRAIGDATATAKRALLARRTALPACLPLTLRALVGTTSLLVTLESLTDDRA